MFRPSITLFAGNLLSENSGLTLEGAKGSLSNVSISWSMCIFDWDLKTVMRLVLLKAGDRKGNKCKQQSRFCFDDAFPSALQCNLKKKNALEVKVFRVLALFFLLICQYVIVGICVSDVAGEEDFERGFLEEAEGDLLRTTITAL